MQFVRAFNQAHNAYFFSAVYGRCDIYKRPIALILFDPYADAFILRDESRKDEGGYWHANCTTVVFTDEDYAHITGAKLLPFKHYARGYTTELDDFTFFQGWPSVLDNHSFLLRILTEGVVPRTETDLPVRPLEGTDGWTYLHTAEEARAFMKQVYGFHDACMEELRYDGASMSVIINAEEWSGMWVELCFEGQVNANIRHWYDDDQWRPAGACYNVSTLQVGNCAVFFALDEEIADGLFETPPNDMTWVKALAVKWRPIPAPPEDNDEFEAE